MRRRLEWPSLILALGASVSMATTAMSAETPEPTKVNLGATQTYKMLGELPVMHMGRIKPLDTVAREEIKSIYTRETIKFTSEDGKTVTSWSPVAAFFDWSVRPKFWDDRPIISVEYLPLKRFILANEIQAALENVAGKAATSEADRARLKALAGNAEIDAGSLRSLVRESNLDKADALTLEKLATKVGEETKWFSPTDLETADVNVDGKKTPCLIWLDSLSKRSDRAGPMIEGKPKLSDLEMKANEVGGRLARYHAIRDRGSMGMFPFLVMPRPANQAMLAYSGEALKKAQFERDRELSQLEEEAAGNLFAYLKDNQTKDQALPGTDPKFDARYTLWLKEKSPWVPLRVIREAPIEELSRAGYPGSKVESYRTAFKAMEDEELASPGRAAEKPALALLDSARDLGTTINASYFPTSEAMGREVHFNDLAPFLWAPVFYGVALLAFIFSLISTNFGASMKMESSFGKLSMLLYLVGIGSFVAGIGLEVYGFYLRVRITSWAPVTNMYETVIWVAMITSILGFIMEAIYRKTYAALAASGVALLGTALAAVNVTLLDSNIHQLPPVLRSNFWLTIHVLTIVSSYAAFALAMGLGMAATTLYLTATYKRTASLGELASPFVAGIPLLGLGIMGYLASYGRFGAGEIIQAYGFWPSVGIGSIGGVVCLSSFVSILGELTNRSIARKSLNPGETLLLDGEIATDAYRSPLEPAPKPNQDRRYEAMRKTSEQIKPISNFIYRSMQVGILLVAAGTFLGGWWADVSWGRFWGWDPKEVWALITLLVYLIPLHGRFAGWVNTFWLVVASVVCFVSVLMAWYGVNFVLGVGLHSYGFTQGGSQGTVGAATLVMLSYAFGAAWRRHLSQNVASVTV